MNDNKKILKPTKPINKHVAEARREFSEAKLIVAENVSYGLDDYKNALNNNVIVVGGSGTGKTRSIVTPNIAEAVGSYIIVDPKGTLRKKYGEYLKHKGYVVYNIDFTHPETSNHYSPLSKNMSTQDIMKFANTIVRCDESENSRTDPFWNQNSAMLVMALVGFMKENNYEEMNFETILDLLRHGERDDEETHESQLQHRFYVHSRRHPDSWACAQFENVNQAPMKTWDTIRCSLSSKFSFFDSLELQKMMKKNDFTFESIGQRKTAVFVTVSDTDRTMDGLVNIFFTQAMNALCDYADNQCEDNRLPIPVRFFLDDFATNCRIDEFPRMISSIRSRGISVMLLIQAESQLASGYGDDKTTIISNCDTYVYLGGNDTETAKSVAIRSNKPLSRILSMEIGECFIFRRGNSPKISKTFDSTECIRKMEEYNLSDRDLSI